MRISACGIICDDCQFFGDVCKGCFEIKGRPFWASEFSAEGVCELYHCAIHDRSYKTCGDCDELPCQRFLNLKDPNVSDEEHRLMLEKRVAILKKISRK